MTQTTGKSTEFENAAALPRLGTAARALANTILAAIDQNFESPLRMHAGSPADSKLYIEASLAAQANGTAQIPSPASLTTTPSTPSTWIDFQAQTNGGSVAIAWPTTVIGTYYRVCLYQLPTGSVQATISSGASSIGALADPMTLMGTGGMPIGWVDLQATSTTGQFKTAGSATNVIENSVSSTARINQFVGGGGSGSGSGGGLLKVAMIDQTYTTLPTGVVVIDGQTVANGDIVLFTGLSSGNNQAYQATVVAGSVTTWTVQTIFSGGVAAPSDCDAVAVKRGTLLAQTVWLFDYETGKWGPLVGSYVMNPVTGSVAGQTGTTITLSTPYTYGAGASFFRNGVRMHAVASFSSDPTLAFFEYQEINGGASSIQILLNGLAPASVDEFFDSSASIRTFMSNPLSEKTVTSARSFGNGTYALGCTVAQVANKTQVTLTAMSYVPGVNAGGTRGDLIVSLNGQTIERKVAGVNDFTNSMVYDEVSSTVFNVYQITASGTQAISSATLITADRSFYSVAQTDALRSHLIPVTDNTFDLGTASKRFGNGFFASGVWIGAGKIRQNASSGALEFSKDGVASYGPLGGGGGGGSGSDLFGTLTADELGQYVSLAPNTFEDDYNHQNKGTKINCASVASALRVNAGQTTASQERLRQTGDTFSKVEGVVVRSQQIVAPKNSGIAGNVVTFDGDMTGLFGAGKKVMVLIELSDTDVGADGERRFIALKNAAGKIARMPATAVYTALTNSTALTITNSDSLDLTMGIAASVLNQYLRVVPYDIQYAAKANLAGTYEELEIDQLCMYSPATLRLSGENFFAEIGALTGTCYRENVAFSANRQYGVAQLHMKTSGNNTIYYYFSIDYGKSWNLFGSATLNTSWNEEFGGLYFQSNPRHVFVSNSGRFVAAYEQLNTGLQFFHVFGHYGDLTLTPSLNNFPDVGMGAGDITGSGSPNWHLSIAGDPIDLSYVFTAGRTDGNAGTYRYYTWSTTPGSQIIAASSTAAANHVYGYEVPVFVTGTGSSHRAHAFHYSASTNYFSHAYYDQGVYTENVVNITTSNTFLGISVRLSGNRAVVSGYGIANEATAFATCADVTASPPVWSALRTLTNPSGSYDRYCGWSSSTPNTWNKLGDRTCVINPFNPLHALFVGDYSMSDGVVHSVLTEVQDVTSFLGVQISQYTDNYVSSWLNSMASWSHTGQTVLCSSTRARTFAVKLHQVGSIASGAALTCAIYATSGGAPTGSPIATSTNSYDPSKITKNTSGQWCYFSFASQTLTGTYAFVLQSTQATGSSNYLAIHASSSNSYGSGDGYYFNPSNSSWNQITGYDFVFELNGEWITDMSSSNSPTDQQLSYYPTSSPLGVGIQTMEGQLENIDNSSVQWTGRRIPASAISFFPIAGHPFRRTISWGSAGVKSTVSDAKIAGYAVANYDPNLVFTTSNGADSCAWIDSVTGAISTTYKSENRSGHGIISSYAGGYSNVPAYTPDGTAEGFQAGYGLFTAGTSHVSYNETISMYAARPLIVEAEIKPTAVGGASATICGNYNAGANYGWFFNINGGGYLGFIGVNTSNSAFYVTASDKTEPLAFHKVRFVWDGTVGKLYRSEVYPYTVFTEVSSYSAQQAMPDSGGSSSFAVGGLYSGGWTQGFNGKIGYVKVGYATSFAYDGFKAQPALIAVQNLGSRIAAKQQVGMLSTTLSNIYNNAGVIQGDASQAAVVDSRDMMLRFTQQLVVQGQYMGLKETIGRPSDRDQSSEQGYAFQFQK